MYNPHYLRRAHGVFDGAVVEGGVAQSVFVNAADAADKGVADRIR